mgnify:FL=1
MPKTTWTPVPEAEARDRYPLERCPGPRCGAQIRWTMTVGLKRRPIDAEPAEDCTFVFRRDLTGEVRAHVLGGGDLRDDDETTWRDHWLTCPDAPPVRRPKRRRRWPVCAGCQYDLDQVDIDAGHIYHPCCEPPDIRDVVAAARTTVTPPDDGQGHLL